LINKGLKGLLIYATITTILQIFCWLLGLYVVAIFAGCWFSWLYITSNLSLFKSTTQRSRARMLFELDSDHPSFDKTRRLQLALSLLYAKPFY
jgi:hypothetical protein